MPIPLGLHSPKLDQARELRTRRGRLEHRRFLLEGTTMLDEALRSGVRPEALYVTEEGMERLGERHAQIDTPIYLIPDRAMARLSELTTPPGILALAPLTLQSLEDLLASGKPLTLLAGVGDPGNAGTLLRSAEIFGLGGAIFGTEGVEPYSPKVVRASMGAIFRLGVAVAGPEETVAAARAHGYTIVATAADGTPLPAFTFPERSLVALGNERRGVGSWLPAWDAEVGIPQHGAGESLNAAVAGSIVFYEMSRRSFG